MTTPHPTEAFRAFARQQIDADDVFRVLIGYDGYLAPPEGAPRGLVSPAHEVWVYTDSGAVAQATAGGSTVGPLTPGHRGRDLFTRLPEGTVAVRVNPTLPPQEGWHVPAGAFPLAKAWALGLDLEADLAGLAPDTSVERAHQILTGYDHYICMLTPTYAVLTLPGRDEFANPAVVCTAPDCARRVLERVQEPLRATLRTVYVKGAEFLEKLPEQGVDGIVFNPAGPGPTRSLPVPPAKGAS